MPFGILHYYPTDAGQNNQDLKKKTQSEIYFVHCFQNQTKPACKTGLHMN